MQPTPSNTDLGHWFDSEIRIYEPKLRAFLERTETEKSDVEDILQETYKRIVELKYKHNIYSPKGLLYSIAKNVRNENLRKKYRRPELQVVEIDEYELTDDSKPIDYLIDSDDFHFIADAIEALPTRCKAVIKLRLFDKYSHKEISAKLDISINTVETQMKRGLHKIRKRFQARQP